MEAGEQLMGVWVEGRREEGMWHEDRQIIDPQS
jgi:hypothetical protein